MKLVLVPFLILSVSWSIGIAKLLPETLHTSISRPVVVNTSDPTASKNFNSSTTSSATSSSKPFLNNTYDWSPKMNVSISGSSLERSPSLGTLFAVPFFIHSSEWVIRPNFSPPLNGIKSVPDFVKKIPFCDPKLCDKGKIHIACGHNNSIADECSKYSEIMDLSAIKAVIVDRHNFFRNWIASGNLTGYEPASRMATMQWDDTLEYLATLNVLTCKFRHDECRNTPQLRYSGQNLAYWSLTGIDIPIKKLYSKTVESWFNEFKLADMELIKAYKTGSDAGHFTVLVSDRNTRLGCAALKQNLKNGRERQYLLACNYATNNIINVQVYNPGKPPASKCSSINPDYKYLCALSENINPNEL